MRRATSFVCRCRHLAAVIFFLSVIPLALGQAQVTGQWNTLSYTMPINPVHAAMLHTGKILIVSGSGNDPNNTNLQAALWDPIAGKITTQTVPYDMFCNGMVILPDGRPFIIGGTKVYLSGGNFDGTSQTAVYDPSTGLFTTMQSMAHGRWYPTGTVLSDGRVMAFSGDNENDVRNSAVEFYTVGTGWSTQFTAPWTPPNYPRMHVLPSGKVFYSGYTTSSALFDPVAVTWTLNVASTNDALGRQYGSSVLLPLQASNGYLPKVLILGGMDPSSGVTTNTTETIDLSVSNPAWKYSAPMSAARVEMNAVLLPSGKVMAIGGSSMNEDGTTASLTADLYDPVTQTMSSAGTEAYARLYHSIALLLPDASVMVAGSNPARGTYESHIENYQPAYLFTTDSGGNTILATRPTISSAPASINYGASFQVQTPDAANISSVSLIRAAAVTHAFDMDQRMIGLSFTTQSGAITVTAPPNGNVAPPGYYMLFLVNNAGVPSIAAFTQVLASSGSGGGISFVQVNSAQPASASTVSVGFSKAQTSGDLNVVVAGWNDTGSTVQSVKDSLGNTYSLAIGPTTGTGLRQSIYYAKNILAGTNTVTVTFNQLASARDIRILEYKGAGAADVSAGASGSSGSNSTVSSGSATTGQAGELIFGAGTTSGGFTGAGSGFTKEIITTGGDIAEDQVASTAGSKSANAVLGAYGTQTWVMQMVTFVPGSSGSSAPTVISVLPNSGSVSGGTGVTITGTNFVAGAGVTFGGNAATNVSVVSSTSITATTPANAAGTVNVVVTNSNGQSGSLANGFTYTSSGSTIGFVQVNSGHSASASTIAVAFTKTQTAGDLNLIAVGWNDTTSTVQSVKDSLGNTYSLAIGPTTGTGLRQSIYYAKNIFAGSNTVTVTFSQSASSPDIRILEYKGVSTLDVTAAASGSSGSNTTVSSGSATTTSANELIFGAGMTSGGFSTAGSGFTKEIITTSGDIAEDQVASTAGSKSASAVLGTYGTQKWLMQMATFK